MPEPATRPRTFGVLVFDGAEELDFVGPWEVITASAMLQKEQGDPVDQALLIAESDQPVRCNKGMRVLPDATTAAHADVDVLVPAALEDQITRLNGVVLRLEKQLAQLTMAIRRGGYGGGAPTGKLMKQVRDPKNDKILLEIFETNLEMQRQIKKKEDADIKSASAPKPKETT